MHDEDWDEPAMLVHPDEDRKANEFAMRVDEAKQELAEAHSATVLHLSLALSALQSATDKPYAFVAQEDRDELLQGLASAHAFARIAIADLNHDIARRAIDAATGLVMFLSASGDARRAWSPDDLIYLAAAVRILRDDLHNRSLLAELREVEQRYASGDITDEDFERRLRARHGRIAANRVNIARLERQIAARPPRTRPPLRLVS